MSAKDSCRMMNGTDKKGERMCLENEYIEAFNNGYKQGREEVERLTREFNDCRNELCYKCGDYKNAHNGACDDCRWKH